MSATPSAQKLEQRLEQLAVRTKELRAGLERFDESIQRGLLLLRSDLALVEVMAQAQAGRARAELNKALDNVESARRNLRVAMTDLALEQGATLSELAKALGVSRQLVSQLAREARAAKDA
jgi:hypothetical protein